MTLRIVRRIGLMLMAGLVAGPGVAAAQAAWVTVDGEAAARIEAPAGAARLACEGRRWRLELFLEAGTAGTGEAELVVDRRVFPVQAHRRGGTLAMALPPEALEPLAAGNRMSLSFAEDPQRPGPISFPLRGSRRAIEEAAARCSAPDMAGFTGLTFSPYSSYARLAAELRAEDVKTFEGATSASPRISAVMAEFGPDRRLLLTSLCGSSWYHGATGCSITGHAAGPGGDWDLVLESEGADIHYDPASRNGGWPDILTLPATASEPRRWRWNGGRYELAN